MSIHMSKNLLVLKMVYISNWSRIPHCIIHDMIVIMVVWNWERQFVTYLKNICSRLVEIKY